MTSDPLELLLRKAGDDLAARAAVPPAPPVGRRRRLLRPSHPGSRGVLLPLLAAALVLGVAGGTNILVRGAAPTAPSGYSGDAPELGTVPLPPDAAPGIDAAPGRKADPPVGPTADLLAVAQTKDGKARLLGVRRGSGAICLVQDYEVPFLNSNGGSACPAPGRKQIDEQPIVMLGHADGTPGSVKRAPLAYGSAPPGTTTVELTSEDGTRTVVPATDGGATTGHRRFFITAWPILKQTTVRALDADGKVLARYARPGPGPEQAKSQCDGASAVLQSHLQGAVIAGQVWAKTHPATRDPQRLAFTNGRRSGPGLSAADPADALARYRRAQAAIGTTGPVETYEYRMGAVVILGDGKDCFPAELLSAARDYLQDSAGTAPLPTKFGKIPG